MKLPLSTTFVTFMVAMGSSLADLAWGRETAVFRITGVISVIGGWFLTAGVAFIGAGLFVIAMYYGGQWVMIALTAITIVVLIRSNFKSRRKPAKSRRLMFRSIISNQDKEQIWPVFLLYLTGKQKNFMSSISENYDKAPKPSSAKTSELSTASSAAFRTRRRPSRTTAARRPSASDSSPEKWPSRKSTWFYLGNNCCMSMLYNLRRITEICKEHTESNFHPCPRSTRKTSRPSAQELQTFSRKPTT
jgi:hypothetical protein